MPDVKLETITPAVAEKYLEKNLCNRHVREGWVSELANIIKMGRWKIVHQGIGFDKMGKLIDGQHRLLAIIKAELPVDMYVARGLDETTREVVDTQAKRTPADILRIHGFNYQNKNFAAMVRHVVGGVGGPTKVSNDEVIRLATTYQEGILFALTNFTPKVKFVATCPVMAPVARAYYKENRKRLEEFCDVLIKGEHGPIREDRGAVVLRQWLLTSPSVRSGGSVIETYKKVQRGLRAFLDREDILRLHAADEDLFDISGV